MRLEPSIYQSLNDQMTREYTASNTYLQMAAWAAARDLSGCANFLHEHAEEERTHMRKIFDYILERGGEPKLQAIPQPHYDYTNVKHLFDKVYEEEKAVTDAIDSIAHTVWQKKDLATFSFLQWFIEEQREEEALATEIVGKINIIGIDGQGLYMIDECVGALVGKDHSPQ